MRIDIIAGIAAMSLFAAYYLPIVVKLKETPLSIVVAGGIVLVAIDIWESLGGSNR